MSNTKRETQQVTCLTTACEFLWATGSYLLACDHQPHYKTVVCFSKSTISVGYPTQTGLVFIDTARAVDMVLMRRTWEGWQKVGPRGSMKFYLTPGQFHALTQALLVEEKQHHALSFSVNEKSFCVDAADGSGRVVVRVPLGLWV
jgi:hypothetical protein